MIQQRILYISYNGLFSHLGQSQILPYLRQLSKKGFEFFVMTFEENSLVSPESLKSEGIRWYFLKRAKGAKVSSVLWNLLRGALLCLFLRLRHRIQVIHARSYLPGLIALITKTVIPNTRYLFDMRGFMLDEYLEGGILKEESFLIQIGRLMERAIFRNANSVVTLTHKSLDILTQPGWKGDRNIPMTVIPCCVDLRDSIKRVRDTRVDKGLKLIYSGSLGSWYALEDMIIFFEILKKRIPNASLEILSPQFELVEQVIRSHSWAESIRYTHVPSSSVRYYLSRADAGLLFYKNGFSRIGTSPIKFAEYLSSGIPVIATSGIGDVDEIIHQYKVGATITSREKESYERVCDQIACLIEDPFLEDRCRAVAEEFYHLDKGVDSLEKVYVSLNQ